MSKFNKIFILLFCLVLTPLFLLFSINKVYAESNQNVIDDFEIESDQVSSLSIKNKNTLQYSHEIEYDNEGRLVSLNQSNTLNSGLKSEKYNTVKDIEDMLVTKGYVDNSYILNYKKEFLNGEGIELFYIKEPKFGIENKYNNIKVLIEKSTNRIISYKKTEKFNEEEKPRISQIEALNIANEFILKRGIQSSIIPTEIKLCVEYENNFFDKNKEEFIIGKDLCIVYNISYGDLNVFVNAIDGEICGGDTSKAMYGKSFYIPTLNQNSNASYLSGVMRKLGYSTSSTKVTSNSSGGKTAFLNFLRGYDNYALTFSGHGSSSSLANDGGSFRVTASEVSSVVHSSSAVWKFVFLDACETMANETWANAFNISNSSSKRIFLGWYDTVKVTVSHDFVKELNNQVGRNLGKNFYGILWDAIRATSHYNPISFRGDKYWSGRV